MKARGPGRPTKYDPAMCETVVQCGVEGMSRAEICAELDISFNTMRNWEDEHPEFLRATTRARELGQAWWERQGRKGIWSRDFNAGAYRLQVMNRFPKDWRDKHEHESATPEEQAARIAALIQAMRDADAA